MPGFLYGAALIPVSKFFSRVAPHVIGCPDPVMANAVVDSAIAFCDESMVMRDLLDPITTRKGTVEYPVDNIDTARGTSRIVNVWFDGGLITPVARATVHVSEFPIGTPTHYATRAYDGELQLRLYPAPDSVKQVVIEVVTRPTRTAASLDDELLERWADTIVHGAVSRICAISGQPYSDSAKSGQAGAMFIHGCRQARIEGSVGQVVTARRVSQRPFA